MFSKPEAIYTWIEIRANDTINFTKIDNRIRFGGEWNESLPAQAYRCSY